MHDVGARGMDRSEYHPMACSGHSGKIAGQPCECPGSEPREGRGFDVIWIEAECSGRCNHGACEVGFETAPQFSIVRSPAAQENALCVPKLPAGCSNSGSRQLAQSALHIGR